MQPSEIQYVLNCISLFSNRKIKNLHGFPPPTPHPSPNVRADPGEFHGWRCLLFNPDAELYGSLGVMYFFSMVLFSTNV